MAAGGVARRGAPCPWCGRRRRGCPRGGRAVARGCMDAMSPQQEHLGPGRSSSVSGETRGFAAADSKKVRPPPGDPAGTRPLVPAPVAEAPRATAGQRGPTGHPATHSPRVLSRRRQSSGLGGTAHRDRGRGSCRGSWGCGGKGLLHGSPEELGVRRCPLELKGL